MSTVNDKSMSRNKLMTTLSHAIGQDNTRGQNYLKNYRRKQGKT